MSFNNKILFSCVISLITIVSCKDNDVSPVTEAVLEASHSQVKKSGEITSVSVVVLGTVQDAGSPQIGCVKDCCKNLPDHVPDRKVVSLGIIDPDVDKKYIIEVTPDFVGQVGLLNDYAMSDNNQLPDGVFLTHAHIGHYTGLMYLGKEAINASEVSVYAMPQMQNFLSTNGPWSQLVDNKNIVLQPLEHNLSLELSSDLSVTPLQVPHRDEFSETVGYIISGPSKSALFIPDIDKWSKWEQDITALVKDVDYALVDATFYDAEEINNRDISEIPHPFVIESMDLFDELSDADKNKIYFTHFNHTNPLLDNKSEQYQLVKTKGYNIATIGDVLQL